VFSLAISDLPWPVTGLDIVDCVNVTIEADARYTHYLRTIRGLASEHVVHIRYMLYEKTIRCYFVV